MGASINYLIFLAAHCPGAYTGGNMYTHPQLTSDLKCCEIYTLLHRYASHVHACSELCSITRETRQRLNSLICRELALAHHRLFIEWWNPQTVHNEFFKITQNFIFSELVDCVSTCHLNMLLQIPA